MTPPDAKSGGFSPATLDGRGLACLRGGRLVFRDLDFTLASGGALILRGPNGSGKTTLLKALAGSLPLLMGQLAWNGDDVRTDADGHRERIHYVGHGDALKPQLTVLENLAFWTGMRGLGAAEGQRAAMAGLEGLGLGPLATLPGGFLSAGQRRRLALARLAAVAAPLWLLDEPTTALDLESAATLVAMIAAHRRAGGMVVAASHDRLAVDGAAVLQLASPQFDDP